MPDDKWSCVIDFNLQNTWQKQHSNDLALPYGLVLCVHLLLKPGHENNKCKIYLFAYVH